MLKWLEKFFKPEVPLDYIVADYKPEKLNRLRDEFRLEELEADTSDEMDVDNLYQKH